MNAIIPFTDQLPDAVLNRPKLREVNKDIVVTAPYATLSIKGKVFTLVKDNERKVLTRPDDPEEVIQSVNAVLLRVNLHAKTYFAKKYTDDEHSENQRPDCYSYDGVAPSPNAGSKQAEKCAVCPHNVWGSRVSEDNTGKGKACQDNARLAIADPTRLDAPMLLRAPPASLRPLKDALKAVKQRNIEYNEAVFRIGFDKEAPSPKLTFRPVGLLGNEAYAQADQMFDNEIVRAIVGADDVVVPHAPAEADELDAAIKAREEAKAALPPPEPKPAAKPAAKPAPAKAKPAPAKPAEEVSGGSLLDGLDGMLGSLASTDD